MNKCTILEEKPVSVNFDSDFVETIAAMGFGWWNKLVGRNYCSDRKEVVGVLLLEMPISTLDRSYLDILKADGFRPAELEELFAFVGADPNVVDRYRDAGDHPKPIWGGSLATLYITKTPSRGMELSIGAGDGEYNMRRDAGALYAAVRI